ncbi:Scn11a [Symbiodinium natans]|uniref:Scn11a protein n=1 Tax=Symbiodinium natans TaxID=878477 RepID=A0A812R396_9DINO|nr:Scn11a [Symbiodinium natans]
MYTRNKCMANLFAVIVLVDFLCTCIDVDTRATGESTADVIQIIADLCLCLYSIDTVLVLIARGLRILLEPMMLTDVFVLLCGYVETLMQYLGYGDLLSSVAVFRMLRLVRILRVGKVLRRTGGFRELQKLIRMLSTCLKTLFWSFIFCFVMMTVWALLIVELVHPLMEEVFEDCLECQRSTSSVMRANVLLFKTVIAGDGWGKVSVPMIEAYPLTAVIFMGSNLTLVFGVMNLIVAVVVDTFAEARQRDVFNLAEEMNNNENIDRERLERIFERIDTDGSGKMTFEELLEGARRDPEFQSRLRVMDIDEADLEQLFEMIDVKGEGEIDAAEFITPLTRWVSDSKTAPRFIKYNVLRSLGQQEELYGLSRRCFQLLDNRMEAIMSMLLEKSPGEALEVPCLADPGETLELERLERAGDRGALCKAEETMELEKLPSTPILQVPEADESVAEQPHTTSPTDLQALGEDAIEAAMDNLEAYVLKATEAALKGSRAAIEKALQEKSTLLMLTEQSWLQAQAKVRPSRPSLQALHQVVGDNLFEKRRRVSEKDELRKGQDSPAKPPTKPRRRSRMATGCFNKPGSGSPARALPAWRNPSSDLDSEGARSPVRGI